MEERNTSIKCARWNGRKEYQYKMCWMECKNGIQYKIAGWNERKGILV